MKITEAYCWGAFIGSVLTWGIVFTFFALGRYRGVKRERQWAEERVRQAGEDKAFSARTSNIERLTSKF